MEESQSSDPRILAYIQAADLLRQDHYDFDVPVGLLDGVGRLGLALSELAHHLELRRGELQRIDRITARINAGLLLDDILDTVYEDFRPLIPYNRIGFSLIDDDGQFVRARWARTDQPTIRLGRGYAGALAGSSLMSILETGEPRILNDLVAYLAKKPESESTQLIVEEGIRSSLTCPLIANGYRVGFVFFSSIKPNTYSDIHVDIFKRIAAQLSVIVDKGQLISDLAVRQAAIEDKNRELQRLNDLRNTFLGMAAHDLRNPIGNVQMMANMLLESPDYFSESEKVGFLNDIFTQSEHMLALLNDLLDVSQIEAGKLDLRPGRLPLQDFLTAAVARHAQLAAPKTTQVVLEACPAVDLWADATRLRQVIDNLISNAVKYSPPGSLVRVSAEAAPGGWRISVRDQGPGITPEDRKHLFRDFARLSARPTGGEKSTGLGLAIARRVVEAHGGEIGVDSEPGHGAVFWVFLPNAR